MQVEYNDSVNFSYSCEESGESYKTEEEANLLYCNIRGGTNEEDKVNFMSQVGT